jgi:hypothetical protein
MPVDVVTATEIRRPRAEVAGFASDPDNATAWYENIKSVEWETAPPVAVASRMMFVATFPGRRASGSSCAPRRGHARLKALLEGGVSR